jgi:hypothetical protein
MPDVVVRDRSEGSGQQGTLDGGTQMPNANASAGKPGSATRSSTGTGSEAGRRSESDNGRAGSAANNGGSESAPPRDDENDGRSASAGSDASAPDDDNHESASTTGGGGSSSAAGSGGDGSAGVGAEASVAGSGGLVAVALPSVSSTSVEGPFAVTVDEQGGAESWAFHPTDLGSNGIKHPIFVWGGGSGTQASDYAVQLSRIASHGFVVVAPNTGPPTSLQLRASLDWILAQDSASGSKFQNKLATERVGMGGHSLGGVNVFEAEGQETRLTTTIHVAAGSTSGMGSLQVKTPTLYICGGGDDIALQNCRNDFDSVQTQQTAFSILDQSDHVSAARNGVPGIVAWLRWHLAGETERKAAFSPGGEYATGIWMTQTKNWD